MAEYSKEERDKIFNVRTNTLTGEIDRYLVNENDDYPPKYADIAKQPPEAVLQKWQGQIDALYKFFQNDTSLGYIFYKLDLCQALVCYMTGDNDNARQYFQRAMEYERFDVALYYTDIIRKVGGKTPKIKGSHRPENTYEFEAAMTNSKGKIPLHKHLTVGLPYAVSSHFSEWTEEERDRYVFLRAIEWLAFPAFISIGFGALLLLAVQPVPLVIGVLVINFVWTIFFAKQFVSLKLSELGVYVNKLKFLTVPIVAIVFLTRHDYKLTVVALLWPIIGILLSLVRINDKRGIIAHNLIFLRTR
jgi:hypothetical protein